MEHMAMVFCVLFKEAAKIVRHPESYDSGTKEMCAKSLEDAGKAMQDLLLTHMMEQAVKEK